MAKRNKAAYFHPHRTIFVDLMRPDMTRQEARAVWHRMFKARGGPVGFSRAAQRAYNVATRLLAAQMKATQSRLEEAA